MLANSINPVPDVRTTFDMVSRPRKPMAQLGVILLCALALKQFYSTASVNELRWILAPTALLVELISGARFQFESYAGYINSDHSFIIAASCAGVNFLLTAFLMLSLGKLWRDGSQNISWRFIPEALGVAYVATLVANTVRIVIALQLRALSPEITGIDPDQLHRLEGILVYFGFLLLLFVLSQRITSSGIRSASPAVAGGSVVQLKPPMKADSHESEHKLRPMVSPNRPHLISITRDLIPDTGPPSPDTRHRSFVPRLIFPLLIYYGTAVGVPLITAAYRPTAIATDLWKHLLFVLLVPLVLVLPFAGFRIYRDHRESANRSS